MRKNGKTVCRNPHRAFLRPVAPAHFCSLSASFNQQTELGTGGHFPPFCATFLRRLANRLNSGPGGGFAPFGDPLLRRLANRLNSGPRGVRSPDSAVFGSSSKLCFWTFLFGPLPASFSQQTELGTGGHFPPFCATFLRRLANRLNSGPEDISALFARPFCAV